ncbi:MAG TPA: class I SAM-dependent methyltransferase [Acidobacteriota bacterium]|nr:class I SAM-dependent methyltransferase [Acidobacteriota bacterium]
MLIDAIKRHASPSQDGRLSIVELGGANSCFLDSILADIRPRSYDVVDNNQYGLSLLAKRIGKSEVVRLHQQSVLALSLSTQADLVFSVGLVEHFDPSSTRQAVLAHFDVLRPGGLTIISFPTPTFFYRIARKCMELLGMWRFHDERPLHPSEVITTIQEQGDVVYQKMLWPVILTQCMVIAKKRVVK